MAEALTDLPPNILTEILTRLPLKSLCASRCVCRTFLNLTSPNNPYFIHLHSLNSPRTLLLQFGDIFKPSSRLRLIEPELDLAVQNFQPRPIFQVPKRRRFSNALRIREDNEFVLVNSCNGLVYLVKRYTRDECSLVCNPATNECMVIPDVDRQSRFGAWMDSMWLGFREGRKEYKVLRMSSSGNGEFLGVQVLVVGCDSWRDVEDRPAWGPGRPSWDAFSIFLNGVIYWLDEELLESIGYFDFEREVFGGILLPCELRKQERMSMSVGLIRGCLCLSYSDSNAESVELWVMGKNGDEGSWRKELVIDDMVDPVGRPIHGQFKPLQVLGNGEVLIWWIKNDLLCYDPRTKSVRFLGFGWLRLDLRAVVFTPRFISLKDTMSVDKAIVQAVRPRSEWDLITVCKWTFILTSFLQLVFAYGITWHEFDLLTVCKWILMLALFGRLVFTLLKLDPNQPVEPRLLEHVSWPVRLWLWNSHQKTW